MAETTKSGALTFSDLSQPDKMKLQHLRKPVLAAAGKFSIVREALRDLAPRMMKIYNGLAATYDNLGGFIGFVRLVDASVPGHAADKDGTEGYRKHRTYYTLDYMRRLVNTRPRGQQGRRDPATDQLARLLATILQIPKDPDPVWAAIAKEFRFNARMIARLKTRVENVRPILNLSDVLKPIRVDESSIIHMEPLTPAARDAARNAVAGEESAARQAVSLVVKRQKGGKQHRTRQTAAA